MEELSLVVLNELVQQVERLTKDVKELKEKVATLEEQQPK